MPTRAQEAALAMLPVVQRPPPVKQEAEKTTDEGAVQESPTEAKRGVDGMRLRIPPASASGRRRP